LNGALPEIPAPVRLTSQGADWLRYQTDQPLEMNPLLLSKLLGSGFPVVYLQEVSRSLEQVYLQAINTSEANQENAHDH
jgi:hypothetical protein